MANLTRNGADIAYEFLQCLKEALRGCDAVFAEAHGVGHKQGDTVVVRKEQADWQAQWTTDGSVLNVLETHHRVLLRHQLYVQFRFPDEDLVLSIDSFSRRCLKPAAVDLARRIRELYPHPNATMVTAALTMPVAAGPIAACRCSNPHAGLGIRCMLKLDHVDGSYTARADILFGFINEPYTPTPEEQDMLALLREARAELAAQLERVRLG